MASPKPTAAARLEQLKDFLTRNKTATSIPFDPDCTRFPKRKDVPQAPYSPQGVQTSWVWGENDNLGRLNLLTPNRVKAAASNEIKTGEMVSLNLPMNQPEVPAFTRESFHHEIKPIVKNVIYDDLWNLNTQSGTQWDGFRHFAHVPSQTFYNNTRGEDIQGSKENYKCSQHYWSDHGIAGRGILLDWRTYADKKGGVSHCFPTSLVGRINETPATGIPFNSFEPDRISYAELEACGKDQGIDIRPQDQGGDIQIGDMLFIRSGFVQSYHLQTKEEREKIALRLRAADQSDAQRWAGLKQEEPMIDWLHDCYFATVAGDAPAFEAWPTNQEYHLHEYLLALWGCPLGEMADLEALSRKCKERGRWTFFVISAPANVPGGVGSHINGTAIF